MLSALMAEVLSFIEAFVPVIASVFTSIMTLIYSGETIGPLGILLSIVLGTAIVSFGFNFVVKIIKSIKLRG